MNRFDKRKQKLITVLAGSDDYMTGKALGMSLNVSLRTIQSEISAINRELPLITSSNKGYSLNKEAHLLLQAAPSSREGNDSHAILRKLIFSNTPWQIDELADSLYMSTTTLEKRLRDFLPVLSKFQLELSRKHAHIQITGEEQNKRKLINHLIFEEISPAFNSIYNLTNYFPDIDIEKIRSIILNSINRYNYYVENVYYNNIIVNIAIALYRMRSDHYVADIHETSDALNSTEYQIAEEICKLYADHCHITPSACDISYISTLLEGHIKPLGQEAVQPAFSDILTPEFISGIDGILKDVFHYYMLEIDYSDYLYSFALHINEMIKRARNTLSASNEILKNIKKNCPFIHDVAVSIAEKIEKKYQIEIVDSEIGYISIHIGYLIETATQNTDKVSVLLVSDDYHHITDTLEKKLWDNFSDLAEIRIFHKMDKESPEDALADLILTTQPQNLLGKRVLNISPFYTMTDHMNVEHAIHSCLKEKKNYRLNKLLASFFHEKLFFKSDDFRTKEEVIRFLGQKAIDFGLVQDDFIESVFKRERMSSTCFFDTFAIPHAIDMNARKTMACVLISSRGISWDEHNIYIVLMITVQQQDRKKFMELYEGIIRILENPEKVTHLVSADTYSEFIQQLITLDPIP